MPASLKTRALAVVAGGGLVCSLTATTVAAESSDRPDDARSTDSRSSLARAEQRAAADRGETFSSRRQTSDGKPGIVVGDPVIALQDRGDARARAAGQRLNETTYQIAPGVTVSEWDQVDGRQPVGQARMNLVSVDLNNPAVTFEYLGGPTVLQRRKVSNLATSAGTLAAVNADFFDISDTGAPLGVGIKRGEGLVTGPRVGWIPENMTMWFNARGPKLGQMSVAWEARNHSDWYIAGFNTPRLPNGGIGVYDTQWRRTKGYSVTEGSTRAREVVLKRGRVVSNRPKLSKGRKIRDNEMVLVGVGKGARQLNKLRRGTKVNFKRKLAGGRAQVAISGDRPLLVDGVRRVINDRIAHPRTAVGIDADGGKLLILVVDGRSAYSRGYTMVELANIMTALGAENALNLDGGGSSAMWSRLTTGEMGLINEPSEGVERRVANGLGVMFHGDPGPVVPIVSPTPTPTPTVTTTPTVSPTTPTTSPTVPTS